jgi:hypothetical protein
MRKNLESGGDMYLNTRDNTGSNVGSDFGGELAGKNGVDLNSGVLNEKAAYMDIPPPVPAEIRVIDCPQNAWDERLQEQIRQINEGMGEGPDNRGIEEQVPRKPEYGEYDD